MNGFWVGLYENLWVQYSFHRNGKYHLTVFEDPSLDSTGTRETFGKVDSITMEGHLIRMTIRGITGTFRRLPDPYLRLKTEDAAAEPSVNQRLVGTYGGRIQGTYVEWTFRSDGRFLQVKPAEASVQEGYYIAGGLELAIKRDGKIILCPYIVRPDTLTVDLPGEGKVILNRKAGQLKTITMDEEGDFGFLWTRDREPGDQVPRGPIICCYLGCDAVVGIPPNDAYDAVVGIGVEAFKGNQTLQNVTIPDCVTKIGNSAFEGCEALRDVLFIGNETEIENPVSFSGYDQAIITALPGSCPLKTIGEGAFRGCKNLVNLNIAESTAQSPNSIYWLIGRSNVKGINLPDGLETIGANAFEGCESITSVAIPVSVTSIGPAAFHDCPNLTLTVTPGSYGYQYAKNCGIPFTLRGE